jgi:threonine/homoserine/homoserine lactone efflux protein
MLRANGGPALLVIDSKTAVFVVVAAVLTVTPGLDMALVTKNALARGLRGGVTSALGIATGCFAWGVASGIGIAAIVAASTSAFTALRLVGAAYLIFLGAQAIRSTFGRRSEEPAPRRAGSPFRQGLVTNLLNPKIAVFYTTVLPQFIVPGESALAKSILLALIHNVLGLVWLSAYSWGVVRLGALLRRPRVRDALERVTGIVLIAFGVRLLFERR